ncbi:MAG: OmpH family outer membrane protein [Akkermansiaceae bacterium]
MNLLRSTFLVLCATVVTAAAAPRIALVRVKDIYTALPSTASLQQEINEERDEIMKDERADLLRNIISELQTLQAKLSDRANPLDEANNRKLARNYEIKRQEAQTLQQEFESFKAQREKLINRKMVAGMRASLSRITAASQKIAEEKGYDAVFDGSGHTNTGVPFVLFNKAAPDLTAEIQAVLKDKELPEKPVEKSPTKP